MQKKPAKPERKPRARVVKRPKAKKFRVAIVGAGRLGTALGRALRKAGHSIDVVVANHSSHARRSAKLIGPGTRALTSRQLDQLQNSPLGEPDLLLIATPDDAIALVARQLSALFTSSTPDRRKRKSTPLAIHVSGALSSEVLQPLRSAGFAIGSLHPLVSVNSPSARPTDFQQAFFCVEGDRPATSAARSIVRDLGGHSFAIQPGSKALYHAAAVTVSGQMVALFDLALQMLGHCGVSSARARQVLMPLMASNLANLSTTDPSRALTGTFARGDISTVEKHIAAMKQEGLSQALAAYVMLGQRSVSLAKQRHTDHTELNKIARLLAKTATRLN